MRWWVKKIVEFYFGSEARISTRCVRHESHRLPDLHLSLTDFRLEKALLLRRQRVIHPAVTGSRLFLNYWLRDVGKGSVEAHHNITRSDKDKNDFPLEDQGCEALRLGKSQGFDPRTRKFR